MLADIASGETGSSDVLMLIAAIVFAIDALVTVLGIAVAANIKGALVAAGLALVAVALLLL